MINFLLLLQILLSALNYPDLDVKNIDPELTKHANTVIRYENTVIDVIKLDRQKVTIESAATILNKEGERAYQGVFMPYYDEYDKVEDIKIEILDAKGKIIHKVKKKEIGDQSHFDGFTIASNARFKYYRHSSNSFPYTIKYTYTIVQPNTGFLRRFMPAKTYHTSVEKASFKINSTLEDYTVLMSAKNNHDESIKLDYDNLRCEMSNVKAILPENYSLRFSDRIPSVSFSTNNFSYFGVEGNFSDWNGYAEWMYQNLLSGRGFLPPKLIEEVSQLVPEGADNETIARTIYEYVVDNMRYVSIQLGIGGYEPFPCEETFNKKYGDCKALSFLTFNLLEHFGIESKYTVVSANSSHEIDLNPSLPGIGQGNHIIICLPDIRDTVWLECTSKVPFGHVSTFTDNRKVFIVDESGGSIVKTKKLSAADNLIIYRFTKTIGDNLSVELQGQNEYYGANIERWRQTKLMSTQEINELLKRDFYSDLPRFQVRDHSIIDLKKPEIGIKESLTFQVPKFAEKAGKYVIIPVFSHSIPISQRLAIERESEIYVRHALEIVYTETIPIPTSYSLVEKDQTVSFQNIFGSIQTKQRVEANQLILELHIVRESGLFPARNVKEFNEFQDALSHLKQQAITLKQELRP